ncbi:MAG: DMT family transporter [Flavobacteriaceae bacterium]
MLIVWFRLLIAAILIFIFIFYFYRDSFKFSNSSLLNFFLGGLLISIHWYLFFYSIKISSISLTLSILSTASLMTSFLEPLFYKRPFRIHELIFGLIAMVGLVLIFGIESENYFAIFVSLICTLLSVLFSLLNGYLIKNHSSFQISFYEIIFGLFIISLIIFFSNIKFSMLMSVNVSDWVYIFILGSLCTAYAFVASNYILRFISPYTMMMSLNLEPVYGIFFSLIIFGEKEYMGTQFYIGAGIIFLGVIGNIVFKYKKIS